MGERYGVLISSTAAPFYPEFFFDVVLMREALIGHGFQDQNIFVLYGNGADYNSATYPANRYRPNPAITDLSATTANVNQIFSDLANGTNGRAQLTDQDLLFVYTFDHGDKVNPLDWSSMSTLCLQDGDMRADDFATAVDQVDYAYRIFCMQQCFSGGFVPHLDNDRTVILTSASAIQVAHPTDDAAEEEWINNTEYTHGEFNFYLLAGLNGQDLLGNTVAPDADGNGFTTLREIFDFIVANETDSATPQYDDGSRDLGERLNPSFADLCLRDNLTDTGVEPTVGGGISMSPDINHFRDELLDPADFLLDPAKLGSNTLFEDIEIGEDNHVYVRVRNRGYSASNATVDVYWTEPSTLPTPASWNLLGTIAVPAVDPDQFTFGGPLAWKKADIPASDHYCFVGVLSNDQDPGPDLSTITDWSTFTSAIRENNNVVWKNFDVENHFAGSYAMLKFHVQGWPRRHALSDLELNLRELPRSVRGELRIVKRLADKASLDGMAETDRSERYVELAVPAGRISALRGMPLNPSDDTQAELRLWIADHARDGVYDIFVRQLIDGVEMGRVTRRIQIGDHPYVGNRRTHELHRRGCDWEKVMSGTNRRAYETPERAVAHGYNGCAYCMPRIDTG